MLHTHISNHMLELSTCDLSLSALPQLRHLSNHSTFRPVVQAYKSSLTRPSPSSCVFGTYTVTVRLRGLTHTCLGVSGSGLQAQLPLLQGLKGCSRGVSPARALSGVLLGEGPATAVMGRTQFLVGQGTEGLCSLPPIDRPGAVPATWASPHSSSPHHSQPGWEPTVSLLPRLEAQSDVTQPWR